MDSNINKVLLLGSGPTQLGIENELDASAFEKLMALKKMGIKVIFINDNPFSVVSEEIQPANVYYQEINFENVKRLIEKEKPNAILPTVSGLNGLQVTWQLIDSGVLERNHVQILGISKDNIAKIINDNNLNDLLSEINEPIISSKIVNDYEEAFDFVREIGFPVIVKPISPNRDTSRKLCSNGEELQAALEYSFSRTYVNQCLIEQSIVGLKEIEMVGVRDVVGNKILVSGLEDMDPIGIHSADSIIFAPTQTLVSQEYQRLRSATFKIMDALNLNGTCHVQFAQSRTDDKYYVTKVSPFFTRNTMLASKATGYPISYISGFLELGILLTEIKLPERFGNSLAIMEPTLDHTVVKIPLWPFEDVPDADRHLNTTIKSVGSVIGIGRSVEEAIIKAMHSSQYSPRDILPTAQKMDEDSLIRQLIHPLENRMLILIEALRRGFSIDELSELTKIDQFYFYKINQLLKIQEYVKDHPLCSEAVKIGHKYGFGDGMLAELWNTDIMSIRKINQDNGFRVTYKEVEPSAGEFIEKTNIFYSSYELENESSPFNSKSALVIGRGGNQLGPNTASDYYTTQVLIELHKLGFKTIIMNTNPNAVSLVPHLSNKQYIEPIQLGNILNIVEIEKPEYVFLPGNRHYLTKQLRKFKNLKVIILPPDQEKTSFNKNKANTAVDLFIDGNNILPITTTTLDTANNKNSLKYITNYYQPMKQHTKYGNYLIDKSISMLKNSDYQGLIQVLFDYDSLTDQFEFIGFRPIRITETAFLSKITGVNWVRVLVKKNVGNVDFNRLEKMVKPDHYLRVANMISQFPFKQLRATQHAGSTQQEVGARLEFKNVN